MKLSLYFARKFLGAFLLVFGVFLAIMYLLDMVEQVRKFAGAGVTLGQAAQLAALNVPQNLYRILPLVTILASLMLFLGLARTSELVVTRAAGRSALVSLVAPVAMALLIGVAAVTFLNPIVAATTKQYEVLANRYAHGDTSILSIGSEGLWLRQGGADGQTVIRATHANLEGTVLSNVTFISFAADGTPASRIEADQASLAPGEWHLTGVKRWPLKDVANPERSATLLDHMTLPTDLTGDRITDSFGKPSVIPVWALPAFINQLTRAGFSARQHRVWFQMELALPLMLAAMVLVGAGFTMRHTRFGKTGMMVLFALLAGFALFFLRNFAQVLGNNGQIPVLLAAWSPPVAATLLSLGFLLHLEDG